MAKIILQFADIAAAAGFQPGPDGKLNLPADQATAIGLAGAAACSLPSWEPGMDALDVDITGPGPVWGHMAIAHALHGRVRTLRYIAPNAPEGIVIYQHGRPDPGTEAILDRCVGFSDD